MRIKFLDKKDMKKRFFVISCFEKRNRQNPAEYCEKTVTTEGKYINYFLHIGEKVSSLSIRELSESDYKDYTSKSAGSES